MRFRILKYIFLPVVLLSFVACEVRYPKDIIQPDKMEALLYDYHLVQTMSTDIAGNEYKRKLYAEYVFDKHGVTKEEFDSSMVWYTRNPKHLYEIYSSLEDRLIAEIGDEADKKGSTANIALSDSVAMEGDVVNLWMGSRLYLLSATPLMNRISYSFKADSTYHIGDSIAMSMNALFIATVDSGTEQTAHAALVVEYADSTFSSAGYTIDVSGRHVVAVPRNFETEIKKVRGYIYYSDNDSLARSKMLIDNFAVMRIHPEVDEEDSE